MGFKAREALWALLARQLHTLRGWGAKGGCGSKRSVIGFSAARRIAVCARVGRCWKTLQVDKRRLGGQLRAKSQKREAWCGRDGGPRFWDFLPGVDQTGRASEGGGLQIFLLGE